MTITTVLHYAMLAPSLCIYLPGLNSAHPLPLRYIIWIFTFAVLIQVGSGSEVCSWSDISGNNIGAGTYSVPALGCKMKKIIYVSVEVTIEGTKNSSIRIWYSYNQIRICKCILTHLHTPIPICSINETATSF